MPELDIAEVARRANLPASTLRYYEDRGLIASIGRRGLRRQFDAGVLERLAVISLGRFAGFSLNEIGDMLGREGKGQIDRSRLAARAEQVETSIRRLERLRDGLRHAADCPAPSHFECPSFRRLMNDANAGVLSARGVSHDG